MIECSVVTDSLHPSDTTNSAHYNQYKEEKMSIFKKAWQSLFGVRVLNFETLTHILQTEIVVSGSVTAIIPELPSFAANMFEPARSTCPENCVLSPAETTSIKRNIQFIRLQGKKSSWLSAMIFTVLIHTDHLKGMFSVLMTSIAISLALHLFTLPIIAFLK